MKTIPFLSILIALAVSFVACSGKSDQAAPANPVGPDMLASDGSNAIPAASLGQAVEYEPYVSDSLTVSFEGTKIRIFNTSGGTRLVEGKPWIWDIDWNVKAWNPDSTEVDLLAISNDPEWHPVKGDINRLNFTIRCDPWLDLWWNGPMTGWNSGFGSELLVNSYVSRHGVLEDGRTYVGTNRGDTRHLNGCPVEELNIRIQYPILGIGWRTDRDTWSLQHNEFSFPAESTIDRRVMWTNITYHAIVPDSSYIESETAWLEALVEDRMGFANQIERMLPISVSFSLVGDPLIVPPDTTAEGHFYDEVFKLALHKLRAEHPRNYGFTARFVGEAVNSFKLRVGIMSERMDETYGSGRRYSGRGMGYVGQPWSVFLYEKKRPFRFASETLVHEIGHNLNLIHTNEDPNYPGYASELNKDAFLVEAGYPHAVHRLDAFHTDPVMLSNHWSSARPWLSEYNWNNILDFFDREISSVSARVVAGGDQIWICNGEH